MHVAGLPISARPRLGLRQQRRGFLFAGATLAPPSRPLPQLPQFATAPARRLSEPLSAATRPPLRHPDPRTARTARVPAARPGAASAAVQDTPGTTPSRLAAHACEGSRYHPRPEHRARLAQGEMPLRHHLTVILYAHRRLPRGAADSHYPDSANRPVGSPPRAAITPLWLWRVDAFPSQWVAIGSAATGLQWSRSCRRTRWFDTWSRWLFSRPTPFSSPTEEFPMPHRAPSDRFRPPQCPVTRASLLHRFAA